MPLHYIENTDETCPNCGGQIYTVDLDEINAECINCKARFVLEGM